MVKRNYSSIPRDEDQIPKERAPEAHRGLSFQEMFIRGTTIVAVVAIGLYGGHSAGRVVGARVLLYRNNVSAKKSTKVSFYERPEVLEMVKHRPDVMNMMKQKTVYGDMDDDEVSDLFRDFKIQFKREYADLDEETNRFKTFRENLHYIDWLNQYNPLAMFGITDAADRSEEERKSNKMSSKYSNYENIKAQLPQDMVALAEKGPQHVIGKKFKLTNGKSGGGKGKNTNSGTSVDPSSHGGHPTGGGVVPPNSPGAPGGPDDTDDSGKSSDQGQVAWADYDMCAACDLFPHLANWGNGSSPDNFDWRDLGAVSSVKNQKSCGSCWAFSTAQDIEGTHFLNTGENVSLSEQQFVACDVENHGCDGGYMSVAMQYVMATGILVSESDYPYLGIEMDYNQPTPTCDTETLQDRMQNWDSSVSAHIEGYQMVAMGKDYEDLMKVVLTKNGPLSTTINAAGFDFYVHGITGCYSILGLTYCGAGSIGEFSYCDPKELDHGVLTVGYGVQDGTEYWLVKNSWGSLWGEDGYIRLSRGENLCGIANMVSHSVYKKVDSTSSSNADSPKTDETPSRLD